MKWLKNLESIAKNKTTGTCPYCGTDSVEFSTRKIKEGWGYGVLWCRSCRKAKLVPRIKITPDNGPRGIIPNNLIY